MVFLKVQNIHLQNKRNICIKITVKSIKISWHIRLYINLLTGSFLGYCCNLPWVFKFKSPLFLVSIKQEEQSKHIGGFFQDVMKT